MFKRMWSEDYVYYTLMGDIILERKFSYQLFGILHVLIG